MSETDLKLVEVGRRFEATALCAQKGYTRGIAALDIDKLVAEKLLPAGTLEKADAIEAEVRAGIADTSNAGVEARGTTQVQAMLMHDIKNDVRRLDRCAANALVGEADLAEYRKFSVKTLTVNALSSSTRKKLGFAEERSAKFTEHGATPEFRKALNGKVLELEKADGDQESAAKALSAKQRAFCEAKGRLYFLIKQINNAGQALHAGDPEAAARYNLSVLYRGGRRAAGKAAEAQPAV